MFVAVYLLANAFASSVGSSMSQDVWLIDTRFLSEPARTSLTVALAVLLAAFALAPRLSLWRRAVTVIACVTLAVIAVRNVTDFYDVWAAGLFRPLVPFPLSLLLVGLFGVLGWAVWSIREPEIGVAQNAEAAVAFAIVAALFPLAQVGFFGTSDYRAKADAVVVFGAKANADGSLSVSLADRVNTAIDLYRAGLVRKLVMSGGVSDTRVDEPMAMRAAAMRAGVPASDILLDENGVDTDATVANTTALFKTNGFRRMLAVSQGYHLPRVKLAYMAAGLDVRTVPAGTSQPIVQTPLYIVREVPAFWTYWMRTMVQR
jgi:vancomycin permeability regulator SanA